MEDILETITKSEIADEYDAARGDGESPGGTAVALAASGWHRSSDASATVLAARLQVRLTLLGQRPSAVLLHPGPPSAIAPHPLLCCLTLGHPLLLRLTPATLCRA